MSLERAIMDNAALPAFEGDRRVYANVGDSMPIPAASRKAVAAYLRVSTKEQNEDSQRAEISRWLAGNGIAEDTIEWFVDVGESGDTLNRPAFSRMQDRIFMGEVQMVVTYRLDRVSRVLKDGINVL